MNLNFAKNRSIHPSANCFSALFSLLSLTACGVLLSAGTARADGNGSGGPIRLARFTEIVGDVSWRPAESAEWSHATRNLPARQGCQIATTPASRCELQFDDGSRLEMGRGALVTLTSLYSDADGEFTEITLRNGTIALRLRKTPAVYQIDTPFVTLDASGPARCRVDADNGVQVACREGKCVVQGNQGKDTLLAGNYLDLPNEQAPYEVRSLPTHDAFDDWCAGLYGREDRYLYSPHHKYLPSDVAIMADDPDDYGDWRYDRRYGRVWHPHVRRADWRPYHDGHWTWIDPFGWTWVSDEPWGWAPYHYGTWVEEPDGWAWCPGPARQYWSPAVVDYCDTNEGVAWCPLAPSEVRYPSTLSVGFRHGDWSLFFAIGGAAVYYPTDRGYCAPRPWSPSYVNSVTYVSQPTYINHNTYYVNNNFVPVNARYAAGASFAPVRTFGGTGAYQPLPRNSTAVFTRGRYVGAPAGSFAPVAGPQNIQPTAIARTPTRVVSAAAPVAATLLARNVRRIAPPAQSPTIARQTLRNPPRPARVVAARPATPAVTVASGSRPFANPAAGRIPAPAPRLPQTAPAQAARQGRPNVPVPVQPNLTPQQRAALQARNALGIRTRTPTRIPCNFTAQPRPMQTSPGARQPAPLASRPARPAGLPKMASVPPARPTRPNVTAPAQSNLTPQQRAALQARNTLGMRSHANPTVPRNITQSQRRPVLQTNPRTAQLPLRPARRTAPGAQTNPGTWTGARPHAPVSRPGFQPRPATVPPRQVASMPRHPVPAPTRPTPPVHPATQPRQAPVHYNAPQYRQRALPALQRPATPPAAPQFQRRQIPVPQRPVQGYTPPIRQRQMPQHLNIPPAPQRPAQVQQRQAPVRNYAPQAPPHQAPVQRRQAPAPQPPPQQGNGANANNPHNRWRR